MGETNKLIKTVEYLGQQTEIRSYNRIPFMLNFIEAEKLIDVCNESKLTKSQVIRLLSQPCCNCGCTSIRYIDSATGETKEMKKPSFLSKRRRNYFTKKS